MKHSVHKTKAPGKKHKLLFIVALCFASTHLFAQLPQFEWANTLRGLTSSFSLSCSSGTSDITTDAGGNIYSVGFFYGSIDANPGAGTTSLDAMESGIRAFIIKTDAAGTLIWARALQGEGTADARSVRVDALGNVYFMGRFSETVDFDPGSGLFEMTSSLSYDAYMEKLDANGDFLWAKKLTGASNIHPGQVVIDPNGYPVWTGLFSGAADFDPNAGVVSLTGNSNAFVLKLDPNGDFVYVKHFASGSANTIEDITMKANGDMLLAGNFSGATDFDPNGGTAQLTTNGSSQDMYLCELNMNGNYLWAKRIGGTNSDQMKGLDLDNAGNIFVTGTFRNYVDFDPGVNSFVLQTSGSTIDDIFVAKYSATGDFYWAKQIGSEEGDFTEECANDIAADPSGNVTIAGFFYDEIDFDPGSGVFNINTSGNRNVFVCGLNTFGAFNYAFNFDMGFDLAMAEATVIEIDDSGSYYIGGYTEGVCDVDPGTGVHNLNHEFYQGLVLRLDPPTSEASFALASNSVCVDRPVGLASTNSALQSSWLWTATGGTIEDPTAPFTSITFDQSGIYTITLTVTSDQGTTVKTQTVNVNTNPEIEIEASPEILCTSSSTTIWVTGSGSVRWSSGQVVSMITVSPTVTTTYTATLTASNGCYATASQLIEVVSQPDVTITVSSDSICVGESVTLTADGAEDYVWSDGSLGSSITVSPTDFAAYSVTGSIDGCNSSANQTIYVSDLPNIAIQSSDNVSCDGESITLTASGGVSYLWSTGETTSSISVSPGSATTYSLSGLNLYGCENSDSQTITVGTSPNINITASNATPCAGSTITLTAVGGSVYLWGSGQTTNAISVSPAVNTTYTVTGANASGCQATFSRTINVDPLPEIDIQSNGNSVCAGSAITLTADGADSYSWNNGQTTAAISVSPASNTTYIVTGTNSFNCQNTASVNIVVTPLPMVSFTNPVTTFCNSGAAYNFSASPSGGTFSGNGMSGSSFNPSQVGLGTHTISYTYTNGACTVTSTIDITVDDCASLDHPDPAAFIRVYPNPADDQLLVSGLEEGGQLELFDAHGKLVAEEILAPGQNMLFLGTIAPGIYNLSLRSGDNTRVLKVVIQH